MQTIGLVSRVWLVGVLGCGGAWSDAPGAHRREPRWTVVQFRGAVVRSQRPDGSPWHQTPPDSASMVIGGLFGLALGNPAAGLALGKALSDPGGDSLAPAPYVVMRIAGAAYRLSAPAQTYTPIWTQPIMVETSGLPGAEPVLVQVMDAIDDSLIGQRQFTAAEFFRYGARTVADPGPVASLDVDVEPHPARQRREYDIRVPGDASIQALSTGIAPSWGAIPVWNDDLVTVTARGSVCPSGMHRDDCFGPDGAAGRWTNYNYPEFRDAPHASLVALFPGAAHYIGSSQQIRADQSGQILLFVNDKDTGNNRGEFQVHVTVEPPR